MNGFYRFFVLPFLLLNSIAFCEEVSVPIEGKFGYFAFFDSKMREVYDGGGLDAQLSYTVPVERIAHIYVSGEYFVRWGRSLNEHQRTTIWGLPISLGVRPILRINEDLKWYGSIGPRYVFIFADNNSDYVEEHMNTSGFGGFINTGIFYTPGTHWLIDIFVETSYCKLDFHSSKHNSFGRNIQVGGFAAGAGLGYRF